MNLLLIAIGGALGAMMRYGVQSLTTTTGITKAWLTMAVNLSGCLVIGIAWGILSRIDSSRVLNHFIITGLLGGYTTFSTFSYDAFAMLRDGRLGAFSLYVAASVIGGILLAAAGYYATVNIAK